MNDPVLKSSRREAVVAVLLWIVAMLYTIAACWILGYHQPPDSLTFVLGFPQWVFWGVLVPWLVCLALSFWYAFKFMKDEDLGPEEEEEEEAAKSE